MNKQQIAGTVSKVKGSLKVEAGKLTEDESLQTEGKLDYISGTILSRYGDMKDRFFKAINKFLDAKG